MIEAINRVTHIKKSNITIKRIFLAFFRRLARIPDKVYFNWPWGFPAKNRARLSVLNGLYKGKRCFIVANGPSLKQLDFSLLRNEYTIGMNRIYLMKDQNGFEPTWFVCADKKRLIFPFHKDMDELSIPSFYPFFLRNYFSKKENQYFINGSFNSVFAKETTCKFGNGNTVTYTAIQLAYCLGFSEIYLIGKDHNFNFSGKAGVGVEVKGEDENHFIKNYFLPGQKWDIPDFELEEFAYKIARKEIETDGRKIFNATIGGKLEVFERVDFYSLFEN